MFLFEKNNRLRSFFRHLNTIAPTKAWDTHPRQTYAASKMMLHPVPHHPDCKYPEVYHPVPSVVFKRDEFTSAVLRPHTRSHCSVHHTEHITGCFHVKVWRMLLMHVNNISHKLGFTWNILIMLQPYLPGRRHCSCTVLHFLLLQMFWPNKQ